MRAARNYSDNCTDMLKTTGQEACPTRLGEETGRSAFLTGAAKRDAIAVGGLSYNRGILDQRAEDQLRAGR